MTDAAAISPRDQLGANAGLLVSTLLWATMFPVTERLLASWDPFIITQGRLGLAGLILLAALYLRQGRAAIVAVPWRRVWLLGALVACSTSLLAIGIMFSGALASAIIAAAAPIVAAFIARVLFAIAVSRGVAVGAALAVAGGVTAALGKAGGFDGVGGGELFILAGISLWILYSQTAQRWLAGHSQLAIAATTVFASSVWIAVALPLLLLSGLAVPRIEFGWQPIALICYLAAGPASISLFLWHYGVSRVGVTIGAMHGNLAPIAVALIGVASGAYPSPAQLIGGALIIAGVLFGQLRAIAVPPPR